jgi:hypothetical protein
MPDRVPPVPFIDTDRRLLSGALFMLADTTSRESEVTCPRCRERLAWNIPSTDSITAGRNQRYRGSSAGGRFLSRPRQYRTRAFLDRDEPRAASWRRAEAHRV